MPEPEPDPLPDPDPDPEPVLPPLDPVPPEEVPLPELLEPVPDDAPVPDEAPVPEGAVEGGAELEVPGDVDVVPGEVEVVVFVCELPPHAVKYASVHSAVMRSEPLKATCCFMTKWPREIEFLGNVPALIRAAHGGVSAAQ